MGNKNTNFMITSNFLKIMLLVMAFSVVACKKDNRRAEAEKAVNEWIGREIKFPEDVQCCVLGKDTTRALCDELFSREFKVLLYVDSTGCSACRLKLYLWQQIIAESHRLFNDKLSFLFYFQPKEENDFAYICMGYQFDYPVFIDINNTINKLNIFSQNAEFQSFLLDKNNRILSIGNPVYNEKVWELYKSIISKQ
jgi:hypothetical protein